jgi:putative transposase
MDCVWRSQYAQGIRDMLVSVFLYVFVAMEIDSRRILHFNVTAPPTAEWTTQQFREILADPHPYRFVVHDRDAIFSVSFDQSLKDFGVRPIRTPVRAPQPNAFCERLIGTLRRECLDYSIPMNERHLKLILKEFVVHYNRGRPHSSLGPGIPEPPQATAPASGQRHKLPNGYRIAKCAILSGLHHEYRLEKRPPSDRRNFCGPQPFKTQTVGMSDISAIVIAASVAPSLHLN